MPRFDLKKFNQRKKELREEAFQRNRDILEADKEINLLETSFKLKKAELDRKSQQCKRLDEKVCEIIAY